MQDEKTAGERFAKLVSTLDVLRGEQGCPWDKQQDKISIADYFLEEVYEAVEALYSGDNQALKEELGDVMMEVVFLARIYKEKGLFHISDVLKAINDKMTRRHPHVFGEKKIENSNQVEKEWNRQKRAEKQKDSVFKKTTKHAPALLESFLIGKRASSCGFDWKKTGSVIKKLKEEIKEIEKAVGSKEKDKVFEEIGDLLFAVSNVSRHLDVNPELALKKANEKFIERFQYIENGLKEKGLDLEKATLEDMDTLWEQSKKE
ncbi:MAG: nucleoside triphosphate pyrophosphohydrolase [Acidobacteriota bacterium]